MKILIVVLLLAVPVSAQERAPSIALAVGSGLDLASTLYALHNTPGAQEGNPLLAHGGTAGLVTMKVGMAAGVIWAVTRISPQHPKAARIIGYAGGIALGGVAVRNWTVR